MSKRYHLRANPLEKYFTKGQCLVDYRYMLDKTIEELRKKMGPDKTIHILEPSAGSKSLVVEYPNVVWHLYDLDPQSDDITRADFLTHKFDRKFDVICCNPPFKYKKQFAEKCMALSDNVIFISPVNCLPFYEYSLKKAYSLDFDVRCLIGIWHYNVNKLMQPKYHRKTFSRYAVRKITRQEYLSRPDKDRLVVLFNYIDWRSNRANLRYDITLPSLFDTYDDQKLEKRFIHFDKFFQPDPDPESNWIRKTSNQFSLAGTYKEPYYVKLKDGKTREDFYKYMNDNIDEFGYRCIGVDLVNPLCVLPLTNEEYQEWFELPEN